MKLKVKKGDNVMIMAGKDKGKTGKIVLAIPRKGLIVVEGINMHKKHQKATKSDGKGQIIEKVMPIDASNVMLMENGKAVRSARKLIAGKTIRVSKKTGKEI
ncbi:MAG: 50S ribosomal protein L24 [Minisyncoccia bacterium]